MCLDPRRRAIATLLLWLWRPVVSRKLLPPDRARRAYLEPHCYLPTDNSPVIAATTRS